MLALIYNSKRKRITQVISLVILSIFLSVSAYALGLPGMGQDIKALSQGSPLHDSTKLLQFKSGRHIIGFKSEKVYMASFDHALSVEFVGSRKVEPKEVLAKQGYSKSGPGLLGRVEYQNQWEGITVRYDATEGGIAESTYLVKPGAEVKAISLKYNVPVEAGTDGSLRFKLSSRKGWMTETAPIAWQEIQGERIPVKVAFKVSDGLVGFEVAGYDPKYPLVIDPVYQWHTFYGQDQVDIGQAIALDGNGNIYIAGWSYPETWQVGSTIPLHPHSGGSDIMVMKLNSEGTYQWHTFYGSADSDKGLGIALDQYGYVYVTGWSDVDGIGGSAWGTDAMSPPRGGTDIVVLKLNSEGTYQWHTFYGSELCPDQSNGIAVDEGGSLYVVGFSTCTWQGDYDADPVHSHAGDGTNDIMVLGLSTYGDYYWHTFYGSSDVDEGLGIALGSYAGSPVYITGYSADTWQGDGNTNPLHGHSSPGTSDLFVMKLNLNGVYHWHTFYGSNNADEGHGIALYSGHLYVTGYSSASWLGDGNTSPIHLFTPAGGEKITVLRLDDEGVYQWHTFYGSDDHTYGKAITVNPNGVYVAGDGYGTWQGEGGRNPLHAHTPGSNMTVLKLNFDGGYQYHTFYGSGDGWGLGITADTGGNVYMTGASNSSWQGDGGVDPLHAYTGSNGYEDVTVLKLNEIVTVTISKAGTGSGTVTSWPAGIDCGSVCSGDYLIGTDISLTAIADSGFTFEGWSGGGCSGTGPCVVSIYGDTTVTATFGPITAVKLLSPNGGETLFTGSSHFIRWETPPEAVTFKLKYSMDKGLTWKSISSPAPIIGSTFEWTLPTLTKNKKSCLVKVDGFKTNNAKLGGDKSNAPFTIEVIKLTSPDGGETLESNSPYTITWTAHTTVREVASIDIFYSTNGGISWKRINTVGGAENSIDWTPSETKTKTKCKVKVVLKDLNGISLGSDVSDAFFTINKL